MDSEDRFYDLMDEAWDLPYGPLKVTLYEEATRTADELGSPEQGWRAREELVDAAAMSGFPEKMLVAFTWMLSTYDQSPDDFDWSQLHGLLWKYKWVAARATDFPQISLDQIARMFDDVADRYQRAGYSLRPLYHIRAIASESTGYGEKAIEDLERWQAAPRDSMADCEACECDDLANIYFGVDDERGLQIVQPILNGKLRCRSVPNETFANILSPLVRLGRAEEAQEYHKKGYRRVIDDRSYLSSLGEHIQFVTRQGDLTRGLRIFERHYALSRKASNLNSRFLFQLAAWVLLDTLIARPKRRPKLRIPLTVIEELGEDQCSLEALRERLRTDVTELAARFNARNGNQYFTTLMADAQQFVADG